MVDIPGGLGANDGFWMQQLRDRYGRFMEMGGGVLFEVTLPGVQGEVHAKGKYIGAIDMTTARIEVLDNSEIPKGVYLIKTDKIETIEAVIPAKYLKEQLDKAKAPPGPLKKSMLGSEVQKEKLRTISRTLKSKGRFPVPRQSNLDTWGKTSDVSVAAQADYKKVYDASPELQEKYKSPEELWERVYKLSVDTDWSSPNELSEIPEEMRLINRQYAKHFLGLEEDGLITVYRNAVNGKNSEIDSAAGYVSTDMSLAYDYNSKKENIGANGRYEIDVKPDEIFGMLGYSKPEDEFAFVIGKGVTSQEGRVRRVGDLAPLPMTAPWLEQYAKDIVYSRGATPYRHHALAGQFNFHEVENFGNDLKEFFAKYNLSADNIKSTFDRLYGSGAYDEYRESGNTVSFNGIRDMFVDLPDGKIGLDITKIYGGSSKGVTFHSYGDASNPDSYKDDRLDNTLKMLSAIQELTGQPFFTHRSRDYVPTGDTKLPPIEESVPEAPETADTTSTAPEAASLEEIIAETSQKYSLKDFTQTGPQRGSNVGGTYTDSDGNSYYSKTARSELHAENEVLASAFYELAGIQAAKMRLGTSKDDTLQVFSKIIPNSTADLRSRLEDPEYKKKLQDGFAIDAWLANWDIAGSAYDNVITDDAGNPVRVDPGGALMFRARGEPKLDAFGNEVKELDSLRNSSVNPVSASVFGDMTEDQLKESASKLLKIPETDVEKLVDAIVTDPDSAKELKTKLIARRKFILEKYGLSEEKKTGIFQEYDPEQRTEAERSNAAEDTPLSDLGFDPEQEIEVYRGVPEDADAINPGDWVTTIPQLAKDYAGTGKVISMKVKAKDLLADPSSGEGAYTEEMVYSPAETETKSVATLKDLKELWRDEPLLSAAELATKITDRMLDSGITEEEIIEAHRHLVEQHNKEAEVDLSKPKDFDKSFAEELIYDWNVWPGGSAPIQYLNEIAKEVFDLKNVDVFGKNPSIVMKEYKKHRKVYEAFVVAMHGETQEYFADRGIKKLAVYRGFRVRDNILPTIVKDVFELTRPTSRPISSWTLDYVQATTFVVDIGVIMRGEIPVSQVFSIPFTGFGTKAESEVVVLGVPDSTKAFFDYNEDLNVSKGVTISDKLKEPDKTFNPSEAFSQETNNTEDVVELKDPEQLELSGEEEKAVLKYTGWGYKDINSYLNGTSGENIPPPEIEILDNLITKNKLSEDGYLYRGIPIPKGLRLDQFLRMLNSGDNGGPAILENLGYSSTSSKKRIAETFVSKYGQDGGVVLRIHAKAGQDAFFVTGDVGIDYEKEYILPRGLKYRVLDYTLIAKSLNNYEYGAIVDVEIVVE